MQNLCDINKSIFLDLFLTVCHNTWEILVSVALWRIICKYYNEEFSHPSRRDVILTIQWFNKLARLSDSFEGSKITFYMTIKLSLGFLSLFLCLWFFFFLYFWGGLRGWVGFLGWYRSLLPGTSVNSWIFFCHVHVVCIFSAYAGMIPASPAVEYSTQISIKEKLNTKVSWYCHICHSLNCMGRNTLISLNLAYLEKLSLRTQFIFSWKQTTLFYLTFKVALKGEV